MTPLNVPDDYNSHWSVCDRCGARYHPADENCPCVPCVKCGQPKSPQDMADEEICKDCEQRELEAADDPAEGDGMDTQIPDVTPTRHRLPDERKSVTHKFDITGYEGYLTAGQYDDGSLGEIFITMAKQGSMVSGLMDTIATLVSIAMQYGVPLEVLVAKFSHTRFEPSGITRNPEIPKAKSLMDYIVRWLGLKFLPAEVFKEHYAEKTDEQNNPIREPERQAAQGS